MTPYLDSRVREYLDKVEWPEGMRVEYSYRPGAVAIVVYKSNWRWQSSENVVKASDLIARAIMHIRLLGHNAYLEDGDA